ncbi:hypothetical protein TWF481_002719 [Arthrobotrys musiformis]|uniref:F-box domain-containing protein n=1 Tax=Arthrobotrys musiformis TaxID=47236 RepID=A0AAV9VSZ8_9PEZI
MSEICNSLPDREVLKLQLVSRAFRQNLPSHRLNSIHHHKTYFLCDDGINKLERISCIPRLAERITHITFELGSPYVALHKRYWCAGIAAGYPQDTRTRILQWYHTQMYFNGGSILTKFINNCGLKCNSLAKWLSLWLQPQNSGLDNEVTTSYNEAFHKIFTLFEIHLATSHFKFQDKHRLLERIISAFRLLPNLEILEFQRTDFTKEDRSIMLATWTSYNPRLAQFLKMNPEVEEGGLPWVDWLSKETVYTHLWEAYPSILFCAAQAKKKIKAVKVGRLSSEYPKSGAMISFFEPEHARVSVTTGRHTTEADLNSWIGCHIEQYREGYHWNYFDISPLFLETVRMVEDLVIWRVQKDSDELQTMINTPRPSVFKLPIGLNLKNLRRLQIDSVRVTLGDLMHFLKTNKGSLKVVNMVHEKRYYFSVYIKGDWRDPMFRDFGIGTKCRLLSAEGEDKMRDYMVWKDTWEEFGRFIMDKDVETDF